MNSDIYYKIRKYQQKLENEPNNSIYQYKLKYYYQMVGGGIKFVKGNGDNEEEQINNGYV